MEIKINDYNDREHFRAMCEDAYNVSRTCEYEKNEMHHIHDGCEILFVESGSADYFIDGKKYHISQGDVLVITAKTHHFRRIHELPYQRYGLTLLPGYYKTMIPDPELLTVFETPVPEVFEKCCKRIDPDIFQQMILLLSSLKYECHENHPFQAEMERAVITQLAVLMFRGFGYSRVHTQTLHPLDRQMQEIKEYIDRHFNEPADLETLSRRFFLHPATISRTFPLCCGMTLKKYINRVRICQAARLLEGTDQSIEDIAQCIGYGCVHTFIRQFKALMEISPLQYRKAYHKNNGIEQKS
ncbi:MAG TPA: helix-turn-helix domain-containing protein [Candidatus Scybalocola faecavium]|nr:helix-turn-helix domain-containing protein [Candidatus Scybalocola faecavium]